jgi:hypothetical protein
VSMRKLRIVLAAALRTEECTEDFLGHIGFARPIAADLWNRVRCVGDAPFIEVMTGWRRQIPRSSAGGCR